jgi:tyrosyl-DNA phosphodiesterase-1|eukprot:COSAG01_NODE_11376_length_1949_cov_1.295676_2_plen_102_part_00
MFDLRWLLRECPYLSDLKVFTILHGHRDGQQEQELLQALPPGCRAHKPPLPPFGTHHTKAALVFSPCALRLMICTANYIAVDWENKTQGVWYQVTGPVKCG